METNEKETVLKKQQCGLLGTLIVRFDGNINSVDIESKGHFYYSNIEGMYKTGNGYSLQTNHFNIENEIKELCHNIADAIYKFTNEKETVLTKKCCMGCKFDNFHEYFNEPEDPCFLCDAHGSMKQILPVGRA